MAFWILHQYADEMQISTGNESKYYLLILDLDVCPEIRV